MVQLKAVIFDLGGTLVDGQGWDVDKDRRWIHSYHYLTQRYPAATWPDCDAYVAAMKEAEAAHWRRVESEHRSGSPSSVLGDGFQRLDRHINEDELLTALDGYAQVIAGWATPFPDAHETLRVLREQGYKLGLLSNTWWAAAWHNADLATHHLDHLLDAVVYTSDLPRSKPHPSVFSEVTHRLGVAPQDCVMVGDMMVDDISGALEMGMRAVWRRNDRWLVPPHIIPTATITHLAELPPLLQQWRAM